VVLRDLLKLQLVRDFLWSHSWNTLAHHILLRICNLSQRTSLQILLVCKHQQQRILHFPVLDDTGELGTGLIDTVAVVRVDDEDQTLSACDLLACCPQVWLTKVSGQGRGKQSQCSLRACSPTRDSALLSQHTREVVSPQRTDLVLASDIPDVELGVLVCDGLDVEANGGDGCDVLIELELVENGCARVSSGLAGEYLELSYWSFQLRRDPASIDASPWTRRFCPSFSRWRHPWSLWRSLLILKCGFVGRCSAGRGRSTRQGQWQT
jgi:hypothetical protein